jgi:putative CRISPR-associated protein (TIGR02619 family)
MRQKFILCTVGTSISNGVPSQSEILKKVTQWNGTLKDFEQDIQNRIRTTKDFTKLSAEINSLNRMNIQRGDKIVFLCSDNAQGRICAEALENVIIEKYNINDADIEIKQIVDLQVYDAKKMREFGLKNFVKTVLLYLENDNIRYSYDIILNPTGGYKGVLPFLTILGMLYGKKIAYIFEFADELIWLPPLPFTYNLQLFERAKPALEYIDKNVAVTKEEYLSKIPNYCESEEMLFMSFTEPFDDLKITISPIAFCFLSMNEQNDKVYIHTFAKEQLDKTDRADQLKINRLIKSCKSSLWRTTHSETWNTTDLLVIKKPKTAERLAGFYEKVNFYIITFFTVHKEYERELKKYWKKNFSDLSKFTEWTCEEEIGVDDSDRDLLADERDLLLIETEKLNTKNKELQNIIDGMKSEQNALSKSNNDLKDEIRLLNEEIKVIKSQNAVNPSNRNFISWLKNIFRI